jgi:hypothetical protein
VNKNETILNICSELLDKITLTKAYLQLNIEKHKIDYSPILLKEIDKIHDDIIKIVDIVNNNKSLK